MISKEKQKKELDNSLSGNKYCFCKNYIESGGKCIICQGLSKSEDYRIINSEAAKKYSIVVTGTNGKTTVTNILGRTLSSVFGDEVAYASTTGIYKGINKIINIEHRASEHYVYLLNQKDNEIVVCEQPEAGIYKFGLPRDHNIGVITNISDDHLDRYWIESGIDDLYAIKSLVAKMAIEGCVTSVDYPWTRKLVHDFDRGNFFILFGFDKEWVNKYSEMGYQVITVENNEFFLISKSNRKSLGLISDYLITLSGILKYNVENIMAILAVLIKASKFSEQLPKLIQSLREIPPSFSVNPARFNVLSCKDCLVVFDYAHNVDGYKLSLESLTRLKKLAKKESVVGLVSVAKDRNKETVKKIAEIIRENIDIPFVRSGEENKNTEYLSQLVKREGNAANIWKGDYVKFIQENCGSDRIVYITIAGRGHISDLADTIKKLNLKDINLDSLG